MKNFRITVGPLVLKSSIEMTEGVNGRPMSHQIGMNMEEINISFSPSSSELPSFLSLPIF